MQDTSEYVVGCCILACASKHAYLRGLLLVSCALFDWHTVGAKKYTSWIKSEAGLKDIYDGDWKPDPNSRGGLVTFKKEKCPWKRRIAKEKANGEEKIHYGRIIFHKGTNSYYIQEGTLKGDGPKPEPMEDYTDTW